MIAQLRELFIFLGMLQVPVACLFAQEQEAILYMRDIGGDFSYAWGERDQTRRDLWGIGHPGFAKELLLRDIAKQGRADLTVTLELLHAKPVRVLVVGGENNVTIDDVRKLLESPKIEVVVLDSVTIDEHRLTELVNSIGESKRVLRSQRLLLQELESDELLKVVVRRRIATGLASALPPGHNNELVELSRNRESQIWANPLKRSTIERVSMVAKSLEHLDLGGSDCTDADIEDLISGLRNLKTLWLDETKISGRTLPKLTNSLLHLDLSRTKIQELPRLEKLQSLALVSAVVISGKLPTPELFPGLRKLNLYGVKIPQAYSEVLRRFNSLENVEVDDAYRSIVPDELLRKSETK